jgi:glycosyltransferase involved in cell wall biosynthesis
MTRTRLVVVGPLPPPVHGVTVSTKLVLENRYLHERFDVSHLDTSDHRSGRNVGRWDRQNVRTAIRAAARLTWTLRGAKGIVYLPLSQSTPGFLRDSLLTLVAHARGWRVAAHLRGSDFRSYYDTSPRTLRWWIRTTLRCIDSIAVMGESLRWMFWGLVPESRVAVVPNGTPEPERLAARRDPGHVLFLSNLRRRKGVLEALDAALLVLDKFPAARFTFAGSWESDELEAELRDRASRADGRIDFRDAVGSRDKAQLLASAGLFLFPPVEPEGHPRVVLEALAAGLPVVATNRGAIKETVVDGESGFVLEDPEPGLLAQRLLMLLGDDDLRTRFGAAARRRYLDLFTQSRADHALAAWLAGGSTDESSAIPR